MADSKRLLIREDLVLSKEADADLSAKRYYGVKLSSDGQMALTAAVSDKPFGLLLDAPAAAGRACRILRKGRAPAVAAENLAIGDWVRLDDDGKAAKFEPGTDATAFGVGQVVVAGDNGEYAGIEWDFGSPISGATAD